MTITRLDPFLRCNSLALEMALVLMNKLDIKPVEGVITSPMVHFKFGRISGTAAPIATSRNEKIAAPSGVYSNFSGAFLQRVSSRVSGVFHSQLNQNLGAFSVFALVLVSVFSVFSGSVMLSNVLLALLALTITVLGFFSFLLRLASLHPLFSTATSTGFAVSRVSTRLMPILVKMIKRLGFSPIDTLFVGTYLSVHDNHYIIKKECVL